MGPTQQIWQVQNEGKMSDIDIDIKTLSDTEFEKKYGKPKSTTTKRFK